MMKFQQEKGGEEMNLFRHSILMCQGPKQFGRGPSTLAFFGNFRKGAIRKRSVGEKQRRFTENTKRMQVESNAERSVWSFLHF